MFVEGVSWHLIRKDNNPKNFCKVRVDSKLVFVIEEDWNSSKYGYITFEVHRLEKFGLMS